jgi:hypothetical protein
MLVSKRSNYHALFGSRNTAIACDNSLLIILFVFNVQQSYSLYNDDYKRENFLPIIFFCLTIVHTRSRNVSNHFEIHP